MPSVIHNNHRSVFWISATIFHAKSLSVGFFKVHTSSVQLHPCFLTSAVLSKRFNSARERILLQDILTVKEVHLKSFLLLSIIG